MAERGDQTLRFGPMRPVGLCDPATGKRPWAAVQLRSENCEGTLYNLVGFQTNLKFGEQKRVFSLIPGLENAEYVRYGVMHRNTFIDSPRLLDGNFRLRKDQNIFFAGQITGVEGYIESAMSGIMAGLGLVQAIKGFNEPVKFSRETMAGALCRLEHPRILRSSPPVQLSGGRQDGGVCTTEQMRASGGRKLDFSAHKESQEIHRVACSGDGGARFAGNHDVHRPTLATRGVASPGVDERGLARSAPGHQPLRNT
jgi:hypothetical protein